MRPYTKSSLFPLPYCDLLVVDDLDLMETASPDPRSKPGYVGIIAGIVSGVAVIAAIIILLIIRQRRRHQAGEESSTVQVRNRIPVHLANMNEDKATKVNNAGPLKVNLDTEEKANKEKEFNKPNNSDFSGKFLEESDTWEKKGKNVYAALTVTAYIQNRALCSNQKQQVTIHDNEKDGGVLLTTILCEPKHPQFGVIPPKIISKEKHLFTGILSTTFGLKRVLSITL